MSINSNYPAAGAPQGYPEQERQKSLEECARLNAHFGPKLPLFLEYEKSIETIIKYSRTSIAPLIWGIIVNVLSTGVLFSVILAGVRIKKRIRDLEDILSGVDEDVWPTLLVLGAIFLLSYALIAIFIIKKVTRKKRILQIREEANRLSLELKQLYRDYGFCPLGPELTDPRIISSLASIIQSGRAVEFRQAIDLFYRDMRVNYNRIQNLRSETLRAAGPDPSGEPPFFSVAKLFFR